MVLDRCLATHVNTPLHETFVTFVSVFGMLLGDTLILDNLDSANEYRKMVGANVTSTNESITTSPCGF